MVMNPTNCPDNRWGSVFPVSNYCPTLVFFSFFLSNFALQPYSASYIRRFSKIWVQTTHEIENFNNPNLYFSYLLESFMALLDHHL
jgi:hypothetical protein